MRTPVDIYEAYKIPPWLQLHQLRVAAVGKMVCDVTRLPVDTHVVVTTCLLHDMGAIVKFNFDDQEQGLGLEALCQPEDIPYWRGVQKEMWKKYGEKEHPATDAIIKELGVSEAVVQTSRGTGFGGMRAALQNNSYEILVAQYADMRVGPFGILSLHDRLSDVRSRYEKRLRDANKYEAFEENFTLSAEIEQRLFADATLVPEDINDVSAAPIIEELRNYPVS